MIVKRSNKPAGTETTKHLNNYAKQLSCIHSQYYLEEMTRFKTTELSIDDTPYHRSFDNQMPALPPHATPYVGVCVDLQEKELLESLKAMGGFWSPTEGLWYAPELYVRRIGLQTRIVKRAAHK